MSNTHVVPSTNPPEPPEEFEVPEDTDMRYSDELLKLREARRQTVEKTKEVADEIERFTNGAH
jgi:hypothetical protein